MNLRISMLIALLLIIGLPDGWLYFRIRQIRSSHFLQLLFWLPALFVVGFLVWVRLKAWDMSDYHTMARLCWGIWGIFLFYIPKMLFTVFDLLHVAYNRIVRRRGGTIFLYTGFVLAFTCVAGLSYGTFVGKDKLQVKDVTIEFPNLPDRLSGLKIVHISDLHLGNWNDRTETIERMVEMVNEQGADLIVCTGDMVNNFADEMLPYVDVLRSMESKHGKYAILGNHDYGDYSTWDSDADRAKNLTSTKEYIRQSGFDLLLNEHRKVEIMGETMQIVGVENWGKPPFKQYGKLSDSMIDTDAKMFTILLSHDSSHWKREVLSHSNISLTLSGHTHAAQVGIYTDRFQWSPSSLIYDEYDGLYQSGDQYMYVNRGIGFVGMPMRLGAYPEITVITLATQR